MPGVVFRFILGMVKKSRNHVCMDCSTKKTRSGALRTRVLNALPVQLICLGTTDKIRVVVVVIVCEDARSNISIIRE